MPEPNPDWFFQPRSRAAGPAEDSGTLLAGPADPTSGLVLEPCDAQTTTVRALAALTGMGWPG